MPGGVPPPGTRDLFDTMRQLFALFCLTITLFGLCLTQPALALTDQVSPRIAQPDAPLDVGVGIEIQQITSVDQKSENFGVVALIRFEWQDPALAFDPADVGQNFLAFTPEEFGDYAHSRQTYAPNFVIQNQQANRWVHQALVAVEPDGTAFAVEKSALTLQAPHFNFRRYPFDTQTFFLELVSTFPQEFVTFRALDDFSGLGDLLGEEEWVLGNERMIVTEVEGLSGRPSAKVALRFTGHRHIQYYVTKIFLPMLVLIAVSWAAFFLDEYRKRAEVAGANLLVFVAFNWAISDDLPRLGYLTFLDFILQWMFVVTGLIVVFNMWLTGLTMAGKDALAARLDGWVVRWIYPLGYAAIVGFAAVRFLSFG